MPPINRPVWNTRWNRNRDRVPVPPIPEARIIVPEPTADPDPAWEIIPEEQITDDIFPPRPTLQESIQRARQQFREQIIANRQNSGLQNPNQGANTREAITREVTVEFDDSSVRIQARATERPRGYWKLRNGKFIAIPEMDNEHLENCIRMCERNSQARGRRADSSSPGVYQELVRERDNRARRLREFTETQRQMLVQVEQLQRMRQEQQQQELVNREWNVHPPITFEIELDDNRPWRAEIAAILPQEPQKIGIPDDAPKRRIKVK